MRKVGILQPGKLGDIIICLPIAKFYFDKGYSIVWPIFYNYVDMLKEVVDYVDFLPVTNNVYECIYEAKDVFIKTSTHTFFDIAATFPGSSVTKEYVACGDGMGREKFDEFKYRKTNVPFPNKWSLSYNRNLNKENEIYNNIVKSVPYNIACFKHSRGKLPVKIESKYPTIEINEHYNIFHWRKVLENAKKIILVDSAMANLVEQLNLTPKKILLRKPGHPTPVFKNNWEIREI